MQTRTFFCFVDTDTIRSATPSALCLTKGGSYYMGPVLANLDTTLCFNTPDQAILFARDKELTQRFSTIMVYPVTLAASINFALGVDPHEPTRIKNGFVRIPTGQPPVAHGCGQPGSPGQLVTHMLKHTPLNLKPYANGYEVAWDGPYRVTLIPLCLEDGTADSWYVYYGQTLVGHRATLSDAKKRALQVMRQKTREFADWLDKATLE